MLFRVKLQKSLDELSETRFKVRMIPLDLGRIGVYTLFEARSEKREARSEKREARSEKREARSEKREAREARSGKRSDGRYDENIG